MIVAIRRPNGSTHELYGVNDFRRTGESTIKFWFDNNSPVSSNPRSIDGDVVSARREDGFLADEIKTEIMTTAATDENYVTIAITNTYPATQQAVDALRTDPEFDFKDSHVEALES